MKQTLTALTLFMALTTFVAVVPGQKPTCSCESPDQTCHGSVTCPSGCTAVCGPRDACYLSCRNDLLYSRITLTFVNKSGQDMASVLSERTHTTIEFEPYKRNVTARYNLEIRDDDVWNALNFLYTRGNVRVNGLDFGKLRKLRREMKSGNISVNFKGISVNGAIANLSFLSGLPFRVKSGDADKTLSLSLQRATLREIVSRISAETGVKIE